MSYLPSSPISGSRMQSDGGNFQHAQKLLVGCGGRKGCLGAVKSHVSKEWFLQQYEDKSLTKMVVVTNSFRVQLKTLTIRKQESSFIQGMPSSTKRERVEDNEGKWVDTKPVHITCLSGLSSSNTSKCFRRENRSTRELKFTSFITRCK